VSQKGLSLSRGLVVPGPLPDEDLFILIQQKLRIDALEERCKILAVAVSSISDGNKAISESLKNTDHHLRNMRNSLLHLSTIDSRVSEINQRFSVGISNLNKEAAKSLQEQKEDMTNQKKEIIKDITRFISVLAGVSTFVFGAITITVGYFIAISGG
jgi:uncharacterized protein YqhQ